MSAADAVPVAIQGMTTSSWLLLALNLLFGGGVMAAVVKVWPQIKKIGSEDRKTDLEHRRDDLDDMRQRITDLEREVHAAKETAHASEMKLVYAINAIQLLAGKVRASDPDDPVLKQAMELLSAAMTGQLNSWANELERSIAKSKRKPDEPS